MSARMLSIRELSVGVFDGPHATPELHDNGAAVFLGIPNIRPDGSLDLAAARWVAEKDLSKWNRRVTPQAHDVVFTYEATLNRYALIPEGLNCTLGRRTALIRPNPEVVDHRYLYYYFYSAAWRAQVDANTLTGATVDRIPLTTFPDFKVFVPDLKAQGVIAEVLASYDDLIAINQRRIALLEQAARLLYREWFVHLRFPGHESVAVSERVPDGWSSVPFGSVATLNYGKALKATERKDGDVPVYGSSGIVGTHAQALVPGGAIVVGRKGNVGSLYLSTVPCYPIDTVFFIHPEQVSLWLFLALHQFNFISSDSAVPGLNRNYAQALPLLLPPAGLRQSFQQMVAPMYEQISALQAQNAQAARARDLLLPKLMSGQLNASRRPLPERDAGAA